MNDYDAEFNIQATRFYLNYLLEKKRDAKKKQYCIWFYKNKLPKFLKSKK